MKSFRSLFTIASITATAFITGCGGDEDNNGPSTHETQLSLLTKTWIVQTVTHQEDRTEEFRDPDFTLTVTGTFNPDKPTGPYAYSVEGDRPTPSPWTTGNGIWTFGTDPSKTILRDDDVEMQYTLNGDKLTLQFTCTTCDEDNGRVTSSDGEWTFVFKAK